VSFDDRTITADLIARALRGDQWALEQFPPGRRAALMRTRERIRAVPDIVAEKMAAAATEEDREAIWTTAMEAALVELEPRPAEHN